ncbi:carboxypeptidase-like regulatory domain-containing protein [Jejuia pallidilutea]|nr:carboxypeptidase-like regulatory domain-containing protein [Jejuia pallidilutea]
MKTHFSISISNPCPEQFSAFKKTAIGGFCNSCKKEVVDFRQMSDTALLDYLHNRPENTCGIFKSSQIKSTMEVQKIKQSKFNFLRVATVAIFSLLSLHSIKAQENTVASKTVKKEVVQDNLLSGVVLDESGPLAGANILLKGTQIGVTADFDGKFKFPKVLQEGDVLLVSYIGYETQKFVIKKNQKFLKVELSGDDINLMGEVEVNEVYSSKQKAK